MKIIKNLIAWLKIPGNTEAKIAVALGYRDAAPIKAWIRRKRIPTYRIVQVVSIIDNKGEQK